MRGSEPSKEGWLSIGSLSGFAGIGVCVGVGVPVEEPVLVLRNTLRLAAPRPSISYTDTVKVPCYKNYVECNIKISKLYKIASYSNHNWF